MQIFAAFLNRFPHFRLSNLAPSTRIGAAGGHHSQKIAEMEISFIGEVNDIVRRSGFLEGFDQERGFASIFPLPVKRIKDTDMSSRNTGKWMDLNRIIGSHKIDAGKGDQGCYHKTDRPAAGNRAF